MCQPMHQSIGDKKSGKQSCTLLCSLGIFLGRYKFYMPCLVRKKFKHSPSHRIFGRMHGTLNIDENKN